MEMYPSEFTTTKYFHYLIQDLSGVVFNSLYCYAMFSPKFVDLVVKTEEQIEIVNDSNEDVQ